MPIRESICKEWHERAKIEYFSAFLKLWLAFNAFYRRLFQNDNLGNSDRKYIEEIKTKDNSVKRRFLELYNGSDDESKTFQLYLFEIIKRYDGGLFGGLMITPSENVRPQMSGVIIQELSFSSFIHPDSTHIHRRPPSYKLIGELYVKDSPNEIFPYLIEIIYTARNELVHGEMEPNDENHEIMKNMYYVLDMLFRDLV